MVDGAVLFLILFMFAPSCLVYVYNIISVFFSQVLSVVAECDAFSNSFELCIV